MKRFFVSSLCGLFFSAVFFSCHGRHHNGNLDVSVSESDNIYKIKAEFDESKDRKVEKYLNEQLRNSTTMSFINTRIDGNLGLDDKTWFYMNKKPGYLEIKLDKNKNSVSSYHTIKELGEGLKDVLTHD
ncbi:MAG: hypothetical protein QM764_09465 [Chitinophagaceae bacterium]